MSLISVEAIPPNTHIAHPLALTRTLPSPNGQPSQITLIMMTTIIMPAESAYRLFQAETTYRHRNQPGDGGWGDGIARHDVVSLSLFFFFPSPFPLRVRRQTASGREWVGSSCGDGALTGVGMEGADALMQVSWIVKGPPVGSTDSHLPTYFFFSRSFLSRPVQTVVRSSSVRVSPAVSSPLPLPPTLYPTGP